MIGQVKLKDGLTNLKITQLMEVLAKIDTCSSGVN